MLTNDVTWSRAMVVGFRRATSVVLLLPVSGCFTRVSYDEDYLTGPPKVALKEQETEIVQFDWEQQGQRVVGQGRWSQHCTVEQTKTVTKRKVYTTTSYVGESLMLGGAVLGIVSGVHYSQASTKSCDTWECESDRADAESAGKLGIYVGIGTVASGLALTSVIGKRVKREPIGTKEVRERRQTSCGTRGDFVSLDLALVSASEAEAEQPLRASAFVDADGSVEFVLPEIDRERSVVIATKHAPPHLEKYLPRGRVLGRLTLEPW